MTYDANDTDADGVVEADVDNASTTTEDLVDAPALVTTGTRHVYERAASAEINSTTNGSGAASEFGNVNRVETGTTADSFALQAYDTGDLSFADLSTKTVLRLVFDIQKPGGDSDDHMYIALSDVELSEDTYTANHFGVGVTGGDFVLTTGDGTTQETTVVVSSVSPGARYVWVVWDGSQAELYDGKLPDNNSPDATNNTNVPSQSTVPNELSTVADNGTNGNRNILRFSEYEIGVGE